MEKGGTAISFVQRHYGVGYAEAVSTLLGNEFGVAYPQRSEKLAEQKPFALPPANKNMHRVFAYLCKTRGIDRNVVSAFAKAHLIYEDAEYHNAVFVGLDSDGIVCFSISRVFMPLRTEARADEQPATPPPTTTTSYSPDTGSTAGEAPIGLYAAGTLNVIAHKAEALSSSNITLADLASPELVTDEAFQLIICALLMAKYGDVVLNLENGVDEI